MSLRALQDKFTNFSIGQSKELADQNRTSNNTEDEEKDMTSLTYGLERASTGAPYD